MTPSTPRSLSRSSMSQLDLWSVGDIADDQRRAHGAGLGLHRPDQCGVVRIADAADHQGQQRAAHRHPARRVPEPSGDFLDAFAHRPADPVGIGQRT